MLPWEKQSTYVETHGGMAGVLGCRTAVNCEIFNDLDFRIVNWWNQLARHPAEFGWRVQTLPDSRAVHEWAAKVVDDDNESLFERAVAFHAIALQSVNQSLSGNPVWRRRISATGQTGKRWSSERVARLAERFWHVQLENIPAEDLLVRLIDCGHAVIYVDPPYRTANTSPYNVNVQDVAKLTELLLSQSGQVAISGYNDEWDHLKWCRYTMECKTHVFGSSISGDKAQKRTEVLWTNYDAQTHGSAAMSIIQPSMFDIL